MTRRRRSTENGIYSALKRYNDLKAIRRGKVVRRATRRAYGRAAGRLARKLWR